ncbi:cysteine synthase A [Chlorobium phaeovibrioides]|uniref:Cysteine synthase n=1 Tax=Chlorobium phaeovibrioides TaxID=1094 RepID=A0A3S0LPQ1_CHLPH|nr:cysteine synthase A [Chlorobium phaeovibrioides]MWV53568.1 cysteine synthase A [Chlorobium phaeovibrioides]RTY36129.1 cysteine synthase A [Chlorobium phaeovibrioides]RTY37855.1 cysteine synthase A [Chlorobium phaeovibrioides]
MKTLYGNITETVGRTPLVRLNRMSEGCRAEVLVKLESFNPLSSVKDRIAVSMIEDAERSGRIGAETTLVEPTSGNTGVGLAFACAAKGIRLMLVMPDSMSVERRRLMRILGAELVLTPGSGGMTGAIREAERLLEEIPDSLMLQQFSNPANPEAHRRTTAVELLEDTGGSIDFFVAGVGTGGTVTGVGEVLKASCPGVRIVAVEPEDSPVLSGGQPGPHKIQGIGAGFVPPVLNLEVIDEVVRVKAEEAGEVARQLALKEGILAGISSGAALKAGLDVARREGMEGKRVVVLLPDSGERYLSTWLFEEE